MPRQFWKRGRLTRWQWFWSRMAVVIGATWILGIAVGFVLLVIACFKLPFGSAVVATAAYLAWCCGGVCACWTCLILGGFTVTGHTNPWEDE